MVNVDDSEVELEGSYWLALLSGPAFTLDEDFMHSGQQYRKGWIVAPGRWYKLRQRSERGYELLPAEVCYAGWVGEGRLVARMIGVVAIDCSCVSSISQVLLVVNHMVFLKDLAFTGSQSGPQGRTLRQTATGPFGASVPRAPGSPSSPRIRTTSCLMRKGSTQAENKLFALVSVSRMCDLYVSGR